MQAQEIAKKQLESANKILSDLKPAITAVDKLGWHKETGMNPATISQYLNNKAKHIDTAQTMITFFKAKIEAREKFLAEA